jgi:hypothetical protein
MPLYLHATLQARDTLQYFCASCMDISCSTVTAPCGAHSPAPRLPQRRLRTLDESATPQQRRSKPLEAQAVTDAAVCRATHKGNGGRRGHSRWDAGSTLVQRGALTAGHVARRRYSRRAAAEAGDVGRDVGGGVTGAEVRVAAASRRSTHVSQRPASAPYLEPPLDGKYPRHCGWARQQGASGGGARGGAALRAGGCLDFDCWTPRRYCRWAASRKPAAAGDAGA